MCIYIKVNGKCMIHSGVLIPALALMIMEQIPAVLENSVKCLFFFLVGNGFNMLLVDNI